MKEGTKLAKEEKIEAAVEKYQQAKELDKIAFIPTWQNLDPEAQATYQAVDGLLNKGMLNEKFPNPGDYPNGVLSM